MRGGNAVEAPFGGVENGSCSEEDERALGMIERLYPAEYRAAKGEVAAAIASDAPASLGGLAGDPVASGRPRRRDACGSDPRGAAHGHGDADGRG